MSGDEKSLRAKQLSPIAQRIRQLVDSTPGLTQTELARRMDRGLSLVNARLTGETDIKVDELPLFARALGVSISELFEDGDTPPQSPEPPSFLGRLLSEEYKVGFADVWRSLTPFERSISAPVLELWTQRARQVQ